MKKISLNKSLLNLSITKIADLDSKLIQGGHTACDSATIPLRPSVGCRVMNNDGIAFEFYEAAEAKLVDDTSLNLDVATLVLID